MNFDNFFVRLVKFWLGSLFIIFLGFYLFPGKFSYLATSTLAFHYWIFLIIQDYCELIPYFFNQKLFEFLFKFYIDITILNWVDDIFLLRLLFTKETESYIFFLIQVLFLVILMIWARAAGPRFRLDQLLNITWKDLFIYTSLLLFAVMYIGIIF